MTFSIQGLSCCSAMVLSVFLGCSEAIIGPVGGPFSSPEPVAEPNRPGPVFVPEKTTGALVSGYVWDPEAFFFTLATCGKDCAFPPITVPEVPTIERSLVKGARVALFDPALGRPSIQALSTTEANGAFRMVDVPIRVKPPFFSFVTPPRDGATDILHHAGPPPEVLAAVPPAIYLPTLTLKPISTRYTQCYGQSALLASNKGVLEAAAKYVSTGGTLTRVGDLLDPRRFGGVLVTWAYQPGPPVMRVPAPTSASSNAGTVLYLNWAPPTLGPPELQSSRGFFVDGTATLSPIGVTVTLLAPREGPTPVQFAVTDPVTDAATGRPWRFPPLPPMPIAPGVVSVNELQALNPGDVPAPPWVCLPTP